MRTVYLLGMVIQNHPNPDTNGIAVVEFEEPATMVRFLRSAGMYNRVEKVLFLDEAQTNADPLGES